MGGMMESKGVQMMLGNLLKSAAPELMETVNSIGGFLQTIVQQLNRIEANQQEILRSINDGRIGTESANAGNGAHGIEETT